MMKEILQCLTEQDQRQFIYAILRDNLSTKLPDGTTLYRKRTDLMKIVESVIEKINAK